MADWIDQDSHDPNMPEGAEDGTYLSQNPPYRTANGLVVTTTEMMALPGMTRDEFERIRPYVAALPAGTPINVCTAKAPVLAMLSRRRHWISAMRNCSPRTGAMAAFRLQTCSATGSRDAQERARSNFRKFRLVPRSDGRAYWHLGIHAVQSDQSKQRHRHPDGAALDRHRVAP